MLINIEKYPIINAFYGIDNTKINVLHILNKNYNKKINVSNKLFKKDPCIGKKKKLYITLKNNKKYEINENDTLQIIDSLIENNKELLINNSKDQEENLNQEKNVNQEKLQEKKLNQELKSELKYELNLEVQNNKSSKFDYILSTNVRDENNILEFLLYHIMIGFDKILVIDHLSKNPVEKEINLLPNEYKNKIEVIRFNAEGPHKLHFLNNIVVPYMKKKCNKYFIHLDGDEYINLNNNYYHIKNLLNDFNNPNILCLNWVLFGSNNKEKNDNKYNCLIPTFTKSEINVNNHWKCIININLLLNNSKIQFINPHQIFDFEKPLAYTNISNKNYLLKDRLLYRELFYVSDPEKRFVHAKAYLNHYTVQSREDYLKRKVNRIRDDANHARNINNQLFKKFNNVNNNNLIKYYKRIENILNIDDLTFVILRYVIDENTNKAWQECYKNIRKFYNNKIVIIDDHSDKKYLSKIDLTNCYIIQSEFKGRGELLPYYYFLKDKFSKKMVVLHDSMILHEKINFSNLSFKNFTRIFSFPNGSYNIDIKYFKDFCEYIKKGDMVFNYHKNNKHQLIGCFGVCYYIEYDFLEKVQNKYNIINLINFIDSREKRKTLERFLSCVFEMEYKSTKLPHLVGNIFDTLNKQKRNKNVVIEKKFYGR